MVDPRPQLRANLEELGEYGKNQAREIRSLEANVKRALKRTEGYINDVLSRAVHIIGNRSMFDVLEARSGTIDLVGGTSVIPINLIDTSLVVTIGTLPPRARGLNVIVKDATNNAAANNISIEPLEDLVNIDDSPSPYVIALSSGVAWFTCDGTNWWTV